MTTAGDRRRDRREGSSGASSAPPSGRARWTATALAVTGVAAGLVLAACTSGSASVQSASTAVSSTSAPATSSASVLTGVTRSSASAAVSTSATATTGPSSTGGGSGNGSDSAGAAYCQSKGGQVQTRDATYGTNDDQTAWLPLAGTTQVCRFQADDEARSRIYVDFATLTSTRPTLAGLAYLAQTPLPASNGGANPATGYCTELGGSSTFGQVGVSGGGWVNKDDPDDVVVGLCVFPDLSFIDEWGLAYHSGGIVRGQDLTQVMTYQPPRPLPDVFPVGTPTEQPSTGSSGVGGAQSSPVTSAAVPSSSSAPTS